MLIAIVAGVALLQWLVFAVMALVSRERKVAFIASTAAFALAWLTLFGMALPKRAKTPTTSAAAIPAGNGGTCIGVERGMSSADVLAKAGKPDEERSDEETRGPGATIRVYRDGRCAVHMIGDRVDFVE